MKGGNCATTQSIFPLSSDTKKFTIKADSVHRRLGLEIMYNKGCLATRCDAGKAFLHKGKSNGGAPLCVLYIPCKRWGLPQPRRSTPTEKEHGGL